MKTLTQRTARELGPVLNRLKHEHLPALRALAADLPALARRRSRSVSGSAASGAAATGALAIGTLAVGALAIGALAIGALAVGRLSIRKARVRSLTVDELTVGTLRIRGTSTAGAALPIDLKADKSPESVVGS